MKILSTELMVALALMLFLGTAARSDDASMTLGAGDDFVVTDSVGIGTPTPQDRLDIHGAICFNSDTNRRIFGASRGGRDA